jgi:TAT (twin-arginine translocation) pathway signal sequence
MSVSRRTILKGTAAIGAATALPVVAASAKPSCTVIDSRIPASLLHAKNAAGPVIDIAHADATFWRSLRAAPAGSVTGITRWSDFVMIRGFLEEQGKRLRDETHDPARELFRWTMT